MNHSRPLFLRLVAIAAFLPSLAFAADEPAAAAPAAAAPTGTAPADTAPADTGPTYSKKGADTCLTCHDSDVVMAVFYGKHAEPTDPHSPFGKGQLQCEACHGPGGNHTKRVKKGETRTPMIRFGRDSEAPVSVQNAQCLGCHQKSVASEWHTGPHDAAKVSCASCHTLHARKDAVLSRYTQPDVCYTCHADIRVQFQKPYAHPVRQGKLACSDCHTPHGTTAEKQLIKSTINQTCFECHAEKRGPFLWEHEPAVENCAICHAPHGSSNPGILAARGPVLCQSCHSQQGHPSFAYGPSGLPGGGGPPATALPLGNCMNCHSQVHGSNHPSGATLTR